MADRELKLVIKNPAATHGVNVDLNLIEEIIEDFRGESRSLPLLQYTLDLLWQKDDLSDRLLDYATYEDLGGVGGALQQQAEKIYQHFESQGQGKAVESIFVQLVTITSDGKRVSKRKNKSGFNDELGKIVDELVLSATDVNPDKRPKDGAEFFDQLRALSEKIDPRKRQLSLELDLPPMPIKQPIRGKESRKKLKSYKTESESSMKRESTTKTSKKKVSARVRRNRRVALGVLIIGFLGAWYTFLGPGSKIVVPSLAGLTINEAKKDLSELGLTVLS